MISNPTEEKTKSKALDDLEDIPLFASKSPESGSMNSDFSALACLMEEETPDEKVEALYAQGNLAARREKNLGAHDAIACFNKALSIEGATNTHMKANINAALARVQNSLGNHGHALSAATAALMIDPLLGEAHYAAAEALVRLGRYSAALIRLEDVLVKRSDSITIDGPTLKACEALKTECETLYAKEKKQEEERKKQEEKEGTKSRTYKEIEDTAEYELRRRGVRIGESIVDVDALEMQAGRKLEVKALPLVEEATGDVIRVDIAFPVVVAFEEVGVIDCVAEYPDTKPLASLLAEVLKERQPWDKKGHYKDTKDCEMYVELEGGKVARIKPSSCIANILNHPKYVLPRFPIIMVVSKKNAPFRKAFLAKYQ